MIIFDKQKYRNNLVRSATRFHDHSFIFQNVSDNIIEILDSITKEFTDILEIGSRSLLAQRIKNPRSYIQTINQIELATKGGNFVIADSEILPFKERSFDLIISCLELHMNNDFRGALAQILKILAKDGLFIASIFGGKTLHELRKTMVEAEIALQIPVTPHIHPMIDIQDLGGILQQIGFKNIVIDSYDIKVSYNNILKLMRDLRYMGQQNILIKRSNRPLTKKILDKISELYLNQFSFGNELIATYEIITMTGIKNG